MNKKNIVKEISHKLGLPYTLADVLVSAQEKPVLLLKYYAQDVRASDDKFEEQNKIIIDYTFKALAASGRRSDQVISTARVQLEKYSSLLTEDNIGKLAKIMSLRGQ